MKIINLNLVSLLASAIFLFILTLNPAASAPSLPPIPLETYRSFAATIARMQASGLVAYHLPPAAGVLAFAVAPRCWQPLGPEDKNTFAAMFLGFCQGYNQDHPGPGEITRFILQDAVTKKPLAQGWLNPPSPETPHVEIYK